MWNDMIQKIQYTPTLHINNAVSVSGTVKNEDMSNIDGIKKPNGIASSDGVSDSKKTEKAAKTECQTCKERKYQDGSDEGNVSFKSATHISPESAAAKVRAHEEEHVSNAYKKAAQNDGKVLRASVSIHTAICPECGRTYVSGGTTHTQIRYGNEDSAFQKNLKSQQSEALKGNRVDLSL